MRKMKLKWKITVLTAMLVALLSILGTVVTVKLTNITVDKLTEVEVYSTELGIDEIEHMNEKRIIAAKRSYIIKSMLFLVLNIFIASVMIYFIVNHALKPITEVSRKIKDIDSNRLDQRLNENYSPEINEITIAFNVMAQQLEDAFLLQKQFAANASHELRTPISSILTNLEVCEMLKELPREELNQTLEVIKRNTIRIKDITKQLFQLSSMERIELLDMIEVGPLFEELKKDILSTQNMRGIEIVLDGLEGEICGNYRLLYSAFFNITQNAVKYNRENGGVYIIGSKADNRYIIRIRDTGIGIAEEELAHIFEPFYRVDKSRSRQMGGSGLGLSIVREVIKRHNGELEIVSKENVGTEVSVILTI